MAAMSCRSERLSRLLVVSACASTEQLLAMIRGNAPRLQVIKCASGMKGSGFPSFLRPGIPQSSRAIKNRFGARFRVLVQSKISQPLELITQLRLRIFQTRLAFRRHNFERMWIQVRLEIASGVRLGHGEQAIVKANFRINRMRGTHPMDGAFDLAIGGWPTGPAVQVRGAAQFSD